MNLLFWEYQLLGKMYIFLMCIKTSELLCLNTKVLVKILTLKFRSSCSATRRHTFYATISISPPYFTLPILSHQHKIVHHGQATRLISLAPFVFCAKLVLIKGKMHFRSIYFDCLDNEGIVLFLRWLLGN